MMVMDNEEFEDIPIGEIMQKIKKDVNEVKSGTRVYKKIRKQNLDEQSEDFNQGYFICDGTGEDDY